MNLYNIYILGSFFEEEDISQFLFLFMKLFPPSWQQNKKIYTYKAGSMLLYGNFRLIHRSQKHWLNKVEFFFPHHFASKEQMEVYSIWPIFACFQPPENDRHKHNLIRKSKPYTYWVVYSPTMKKKQKRSYVLM